MFDCAGPSAGDISGSDYFWYWPCASFLHVSVAPSDESLGYVRSTPYAIDCPNACTRPFAQGAMVTLTAYPSLGASFDGWGSDACTGQGNPCVVAVDGDTQVTADFSGRAIPPAVDAGDQLVMLHTFMGNMAGDPTSVVTGTGGFTCSFTELNCFKTYPKGTVVTLTETGVDSEDVLFNDTAAGSGHANPYTFTLTEDRSVSPYTTP